MAIKTEGSLSGPFISIVIPVYNMAGKIGRCLDSIAGQSFKDKEVIVVDDGSTDGTGEVVQAFARNNDNVKYLREDNAGVSAARNAGIGASSGEYLLFIDADDEIEEDYLRNIAEKAKATGADLLVWGIKRCFEDGRIEEWRPKMGGVFDRKSFLEAFPREQYGRHEGLYGFVANKLTKREIVLRNGLRFDPSLTLMEDYDFFLSCYSRCETFCCFPETGYHYHICSSGGSGDRKEVIYRKLIGVHTKCADLLKSEDALTAKNGHLLSGAIGGLSLSLFLDMDDTGYTNVKSCMDFLWENPYCIPALKEINPEKKTLKRWILKRNVPMTFLYTKGWRLYMFFRTGGKG